MSPNGENNHYQAVIGGGDSCNKNKTSFWLYSSETGFDLTHTGALSPLSSQRLTLRTTTASLITVDPAKSALIIIDMQNFFLSPAFGRSTDSRGHTALAELAQHAIPAARLAGIRVVWLNWGLTEAEVEEMPPAVTRAFGFCAIEDEKEIPVDKHGNRLVVPSEIAKKCGQQDEGAKVHKAPMGLGSDCGMVTNPATGQPIDAGRLLMRDAWNSALYPPLDAIYEEGRRRAVRPDKWVHKNRMSGMWGARTACEDFLEREDIRTLFFGGVNTDQCEFVFVPIICVSFWQNISRPPRLEAMQRKAVWQ